MDEELEQFCKNCKKYVGAANFVSHIAFCQRNITICKVCDEPILKYSKEEHEKEYHISVICDMCNTSVKKWRLEKHQEKICPKRLVICEFCEVKFPIDGIQEHNEFCGSRTEKCKTCFKYIMLRHKKKHLEVHMHGENFHRGNGAGEIHQNTMNKIISKTSGKALNSTETCRNYGKKVPVHELSSHKQVCSKILKKQCEYCDKELHCDDPEENHLKICAVYNHSISETHLLSKHFKDLFTNENCWDTVLQVGSKEFKVHRAILSARSSVFFAMFQHDTSEKQTGIVKIPDCDPDSFQQFLEYLYCGKLKHFSSDIALPLYIISDKYNVQELKTYCTKYLMKNITVQSMCEVAILADRFDETQLISATEDFFNKNFKEIVMTSEWENLMKKNFRLANKLLIGKAKAE